MKFPSTQEIVYNPSYGDERICECGHPYNQHFDSYEGMKFIGCKYCICDHFTEKVEDLSGKPQSSWNKQDTLTWEERRDIPYNPMLELKERCPPPKIVYRVEGQTYFQPPASNHWLEIAVVDSSDEARMEQLLARQARKWERVRIVRETTNYEVLTEAEESFDYIQYT